MNKLISCTIAYFFFSTIILFGQVNDSNNPEKVNIHLLSGPEQLTPLNSNDNAATIIFQNIFQTLLNVDHFTHEVIPILAKERPTFSELPNGKLRADMEIKAAAKWDNGTPITGDDVAFTLKVLKNPKTDSRALKPYFEDVEDIKIDKDNPKKFSIIFNKPYMIIESALSDLPIIPSYIYDSGDLMESFTLKQLCDDKALENDSTIIRFANHFNSKKFQREVVVGSGAYTVDTWAMNQHVRLKLKEDWWGHTLRNVNYRFEAYPKQLVYNILYDIETATVALKQESFDAMHVSPDTYIKKLRDVEDLDEKFQVQVAPQFAYDYIAINTRRPKFADARTRRALAHIMDSEKVISGFLHGYGERLASFSHPEIKERQNPDIQPYVHSLRKAKRLLKKAGWKDTNKNGILDKEINGERVEFNIDINYNTGNSRREYTCKIFQAKCKQAGINVNVVQLTWSSLLNVGKTHNFDMLIAGWISSPLEADPKQIWHTDSQYHGGVNYTGFGNAASDMLIEQLRREMDQDKRNELYKNLHQTIHDEVPYIFLFTQKNITLVSRRFKNAQASGVRPYFWHAGFQLAD